jgi:HEAT repeat protein
MVALDEKDSAVRLRAARAPGRNGDERAVGKLIRTLRDGDWSLCPERSGRTRQPMPSS